MIKLSSNNSKKNYESKWRKAMNLRIRTTFAYIFTRLYFEFEILRLPSLFIVVTFFRVYYYYYQTIFFETFFYFFSKGERL